MGSLPDTSAASEGDKILRTQRNYRPPLALTEGAGSGQRGSGHGCPSPGAMCSAPGAAAPETALLLPAQIIIFFAALYHKFPFSSLPHPTPPPLILSRRLRRAAPGAGPAPSRRREGSSPGGSRVPPPPAPAALPSPGSTYRLAAGPCAAAPQLRVAKMAPVDGGEVVPGPRPVSHRGAGRLGSTRRGSARHDTPRAAARAPPGPARRWRRPQLGSPGLC